MDLTENPRASQVDGTGPMPDPNALVFNILRLALTDEPFESQLENILALLIEALRVDAGLIFMAGQKREGLNLVAAQGVEEGVLAGVTALDSPQLMAEIFRENGRPTLISEAWDLPPFDRLTAAFGRLILAPLRGQERPLGLLIFCRRALGGRPPLDLELIGLLSSQVAVFLENEQLHRKAEELAILDERNRLARELHDSVTQSLYSLTLFAEASERMLAAGQIDQARAHLVRVSETGLQALREMRLLVHRLRPPILAEEGLRAAIQQRLRSVEGRTGVEYRLLMGDEIVLPAALEETVYHVIQEALNNALKHARSSQVEVVLEREAEHLTVAIKDNGVGFDPEAQRETAGLGLISMRERAELAGGGLSIESAVGEGTTIKAVLPLRRPRREG